MKAPPTLQRLGRFVVAAAAAVAIGMVAGCSSEQAYRAGQGWQQNQCKRLPDKADYDRCMADASMSHDTYKRETGK